MSRVETGRPPRPLIIGIPGPEADPDTVAMLRAVQPLGMILMGRNCVTPAQVKTLTATLREVLEDDTAPILIDQEGGRVARLNRPNWHAFPPLARIGDCYAADAAAGQAAAALHGRLIGEMLRAHAIDVDCAPVLDVPVPGSHAVIGDRAFSGDAAAVSAVAVSYCAGLIAAGITPVIKHLPGHGRARADSHKELPQVLAPQGDLAAQDFAPFQAVARHPVGVACWGMVAHVAYDALDPGHAATQSPVVVAQALRTEIGFAGPLLADDLCMDALRGPMTERAQRCFDAGMDVVLHCSGDLDEPRAIAAITPPMSDLVAERLSRSRIAPPRTGLPYGSDAWGAAFRRLDDVLSTAATS